MRKAKKRDIKKSTKVSENKSEKHESLLIEKRELKKEFMARKPFLLCSSIPFCLSACDVGTTREIEEALKEYEDVFPQELPYGLPPLRGIEHHMDLVSGSQLANRPSYRTIPQEANEIAKQVQELLDKGWVRESMSPCASPIILVPKKERKWRMCTDYRAINNITVRYRHPIPRLNDF